MDMAVPESGLTRLLDTPTARDGGRVWGHRRNAANNQAVVIGDEIQHGGVPPFTKYSGPESERMPTSSRREQDYVIAEDFRNLFLTTGFIAQR